MATTTSYQVLARKYRPQTFADVAGQDAVVQTLTRALDSGRVAHAFLFTGSRGVGKTTLARILAKCLVCEKGVTSKPDNTCPLCMGVAQGSLADVVEIDGASNTGVDQVRDLQQVARFMPQLARFRIFIIDEVHMLSTPAFNALLKILEEPPPHVKFVFATTEPHKIPVTVLSRCQRYDFRRLPMTTIIARLKSVLATEQVAVADGGLEVIARAAEGGMRDALSLTDQVLSFAGPGATAEQVTEALGIIDRRSIVAAVEACITGDAKTALGVVENAFVRGHDQRQLLQGIAEELRHLAVASATGTVRGFADLPDEEIARIDARAKQIEPRDLTRLMGIALDGVDPVAKSEDPRMFVELALLKMCGRAPLGDALAISEAIVRLDALAKGKPVPPLTPRAPREGGAPHPVPVPVPVPVPAPASPPPVKAITTPTPTPTPTTTTTPTTTPPDLIGEDPPEIGEPAAAAPVAAAASVTSAATSEPAFDDAAEVNEPIEVGAMMAAAMQARAASAPVAAAPSEPAVEDSSDDDDDGIDPAAGLPLEGVDPRFVDFVDRVARAHRPMAMHLDHAHMARFDKGVVEIFFQRDMHATALKGAVDSNAIKDALAHSFGDGTRLVIAPAASATLAPGATPSIAEARQRALEEAQRQLEAHAKSHPVVEKAVALFGGAVRSVRRRGA